MVKIAIKNLACVLLVLTLAACTSLQELPKTAEGSKDAALVDPYSPPVDGSSKGGNTQPPDAGPPPCTPGSVGCACADGQCDTGLNCQDLKCSSPSCGDGKKDFAEECDSGSENNDTKYGGCKTNCTLGPRCGDGVKIGAEECDDGNTDDTDLCSSTCKSCESKSGFLACGNRCVAGASCCSGEACRPASCAGNAFTATSTCDALFKCPAVVTAECAAGLSCDQNMCRMTCSSNSHCAAGRTCSGGACVVKGCGNGVIEAPETCEDGNAIDDDACSNGCVRCADRSGYRECSVNGATKCIANAVCCPGAICSPGICSESNLTQPQTCNAKGECPVESASACPNNFVCEGTSCRKSCSSNGQCANGRFCHQGACIVPLCGNGMVEPGESCDNGASNADGALCGSDCKTCQVRGRKECGSVCLAAGQCCGDSDCPLATTGGKCNQDTKLCWKRVTVSLPVALGGDCNSVACARGTYLNIQSEPYETWGFLGFDFTVPTGGTIERAILTIHRFSLEGSFEGSTLRVASCPPLRSAGPLTVRGEDCRADTLSPTLCKPTDSKCVVDLTIPIRFNSRDFVLDFLPVPGYVKAIYYGATHGAVEPKFDVTYIAP